MRNLGMVIEYLGTDYAGFQRQPNQRTIQGTLEESLATILREKVAIVAAGRTDAGVHAYGQVINLRTNAPIDLAKLQWSTNCILPKDISIKRIFTVPQNFNSRRDAISREYIYQIINRPYRSAFLGEIALFYPWELNIKEMEKAAKHFITTADFSSFAHIEKDVVKKKVKTINRLKIANKEGLLSVDICADSFLHNMVRIIVGTLLEVGAGRRKSNQIKSVIESKDRLQAGETAPPHGLILKAVNYPANINLSG